MAHNHRETSDTHFCGVGLVSPKNGYNVGAAVRAAGCLGASFVVASGTRFKEMKSDFRNMDTELARKRMPCYLGINDVMDFLPYDCIPVAIERDETATNLVDFVHPRRAFYIFGSEDSAVPPEVVAKCKHKVYVPTTGSMNLGATTYIVLYDRIAKMAKMVNEDDKCPECGNSHYKEVELKVAEHVPYRHCNACGFEGIAASWRP
jgi:tRNA(Leu) C34 or U34 (ribose-2'-O)-methylase TrmL